MRWLAALFLLWIPAILGAQTQPQTFRNPDGIFAFQYPASLIQCTQEKQKDDDSPAWVPTDSCDAMTPVCDDEGSQGSRTLACFAFPRAEFKDYPAFNAAAFSVAVITEATTEKECLDGSPDWNVDPRGSGQFVDLHATRFKVFDVSDAGMSHALSGEVYRGFHGNACYELSIKTATTSPSVFNQPIKEFTDDDQDAVDARLKQALNSFVFLK